MSQIQVDEYEGTPIYLDKGWFIIKIKDNVIKHRTLSGLLNQVSKLQDPKDAMIVSHYGVRSPRRVQVVYDRKALRFRDVENGKLLDYGSVYKYDPDVFAAMENIAITEHELILLWNEQVKKLVKP